MASKADWPISVVAYWGISISSGINQGFEQSVVQFVDDAKLRALAHVEPQVCADHAGHRADLVPRARSPAHMSARPAVRSQGVDPTRLVGGQAEDRQRGERAEEPLTCVANFWLGALGSTRPAVAGSVRTRGDSD